jgi:polysaccharide pyruvyl transferase WcaK-like protein
LSSILQKPFVALIYDVKVQQLTHFLEMDRLAIDINQPFEAVELVNNITMAIDHEREIVENLSIQVSEAAEQLSNYFASMNKQLISPST